MFLNFFWFEIKYRLHRVSTYVYFGVMFLMALLSVSAADFGPVGSGKVNLNGPWSVMDILVQIGSFGIFIISAIFGMSALRDFSDDTYQLIFTKPISKFAYLGGRWLGSFVVTVGVFSGLLFGVAAAPYMPWADHSRMQALQAGLLIQPFVSITVVQIFFLGSFFFMAAALTRRVMTVYLQGIILFALYLIGAVTVLNARSLQTFWPSVLDPLGLVLFFTVTRYWTIVEKNTQIFHWTGVFLWNRVLWSSVGLVSLGATFAFFPMAAEALTRKQTKRKRRTQATEEEEIQPVKHRLRVVLPKVRQIFAAATTWAQLFTLTRMRLANILRELTFWGIAAVMIAFAIINGREAGQLGDWHVWPVTYLMAGVLTGSSSLFLYIVATLYAGELIWRERDVRFEQINDALPVPSWIHFVSRLLALASVELLLISIVMLCGILIQAFSGYYHFELGVYFRELYLIYFAQVLTFALFALFAQTILPNKFLAHGFVIGFVLLVPILYRYGVENRLYLFGEVTPYTYSDMNGYGHFVPGLFWSIFYWLCCGGLLGVAAIAFARRGTDLAWRSRWREARERVPALTLPAILLLCLLVGSGSWFFYNAHVLNEFRTAKQQRHRQAEYERKYKRYERLAQPKIVAVDTIVEVFPERRAFRATGHDLLVNHSGQPISDIHITDAQESVDEVHFDRPARQTLADRLLRYSIYHLEQPLQPGEELRMNYRVSYTTHGFRDGNEKAELAYNGTFFDQSYFPSIGYMQSAELDDPTRRREEHLPPLEEMAPPGDPYYRNINLFTSDSEWIKYHTIVSTSSDQIAVAPGYLKREWTQNGRRFFEYDMGNTRINNFFSYISGRFAVKRDRWKNVQLEIYYQPGHEYNLDRMLDASKRGLDYFEKNFGPYQFTQFRVLEYPRYRQFAQSFPNTVPYSEALGFIAHRSKPSDLDEVSYITAHELAHQWWGHQLIGSATQGSNMMSETLAQYSALMIMEKEYGQENIRKFLKYELDSYLRGRSGEIRREPPLMLVQREPYVWYRKGSLVMYALRDYLGEDRLNTALRNYLAANKFANPPYPDTRSFVAALRQASPPEMQYLITDMFETITLFDNKAVSATYSPLANGKYKVRLKLTSRKVRADGLGNEKDTPVSDLIDIGVFTGSGESLQPLYLQKHRITMGDCAIDLVVDRKPDRAGIDPYNKLIDRNPEDNLIAVTRQ